MRLQLRWAPPAAPSLPRLWGSGLAVTTKATLRSRSTIDRSVQPSPGSTAAAISAFSDALAKDVRTPIVDPPASAADAYPISGLTFILIRKDRSDPGEQEAIKDFIAFAISTGQDSAEELSYAKLPDSVQRQGQELLSQLTANGQPLK